MKIIVWNDSVVATNYIQQNNILPYYVQHYIINNIKNQWKSGR